MTEIVTRIVHQAAESIIIQILTQLLKREPTPEDAKRLTMVYSDERYSLGYFDWCVLLFDGVNIGRIVWEINGCDGTVKFEPNSAFK